MSLVRLLSLRLDESRQPGGGKGLPVPDSLRTDQKKDVPFISYLVPLPSKNSSLHWEKGVRLAAGYYSVRAQLQSSLTLK